jgi:peptidoglycan DL-endopeptidase CwlO
LPAITTAGRSARAVLVLAIVLPAAWTAGPARGNSHGRDPVAAARDYLSQAKTTVATAQARLTTLNASAAAASARLAKAIPEMEAARALQAAAEDAARRADAELRGMQARTTRFAVAAYTSGGGLNQMVLAVSSGAPQEFFNQVGTLNQVAVNARDITTHLAEVKREQAAAKEAATAAAAEAQRAEHAAQAATDALADQVKQQQVLIDYLTQQVTKAQAALTAAVQQAEAQRQAELRRQAEARLRAEQAQQAALAAARQRQAALVAQLQRSPSGLASGVASRSQAPVRAPVAYGDPRAIARSMLPSRGWSGQWSCLDTLWTVESSWQVTATNPSSGAYGIPQALPAWKMASAGPDWQTNPATQIVWGLGYIAARYGGPCAAWQFHLTYGWY